MKKRILFVVFSMVLCFAFVSCEKPEETEKISMNAEKWNAMWNLWAEGKVESPYAELMTYQSEINNGGHEQYFANIENNGDIEKEIDALQQILPRKLRTNLRKAYRAYRALEKNEDNERAEAKLERCDELYYKYENEIDSILIEYSLKIED